MNKIYNFKRKNDLLNLVITCENRVEITMISNKSYVGNFKFNTIDDKIELENIVIDENYQGDGLGYICVWLLCNVGLKLNKTILRVVKGGGDGKKIKGCEMYKIWNKYGLVVPEKERVIALEIYMNKVRQNMNMLKNPLEEPHPNCVNIGEGIVCDINEIEKVGLFNYEGNIINVMDLCYDGFLKKNWSLQNSF